MLRVFKRKHNNSKRHQVDESIHLGKSLVEDGYITMDELMNTLHDRYGLSMKSIPKDFEALFNKKKPPLSKRLSILKIPIWLQLSVATTLIIVLTIFLLNSFILNRQREHLYQQTVKIGMVSLGYIDTNARIPLLDDNILRLNTLIKDVADVEGLVYAIILDNKKKIKAHSDHKKIGTAFEGFTQVVDVKSKGEITYFDYRLPSGERCLNLSRPVFFKDKHLGEVHVGVSIDFIEQVVREERLAIFGMTLFIVFIGIAIAVFFGLRFSRPISQLVLATREISKGNYQHKLRLNRKDELGNLAKAFNQMNQELWMKSLMQESFGKYVGAHVLDLIMKNPEKTWLKGQTNEATILFADIRGFTKYSESKAPQEIVDELNAYFEIATRVILKHGGYIDKFIGDAILGVFGVPAYHKNHARRAVRAAFDMQQTLRNTDMKSNVLLSSVGIGLHSGLVVSGNIGSPVKMEYTVIGDCVNLASHISQLAGPGEVIISKKIYQKLSGILDVQALPPQQIKGKSIPVTTYKVLKVKKPLKVHENDKNKSSI